MTGPTRRPVPADLFGGRLTECFLLDLEVAAVATPRPGMRTITFTSPDLVGFTALPGQDVMLSVPGADTGVRRRYTIRRCDPAAGTLDIEVVLHGTGPFASWASSAALGDHIDGIGPRGVITVRNGAAHHLFVADPSAIPFAFAMIESLPAGASATAIIATDDPIDALDAALDAPASAAAVRVHRVAIADVSGGLATVGLPDGTAAYVNGERRLVRQATDLLIDRGVPADAIASKAYWRLDQANKPHGEPAKE
jgi:NADPH-dependent ferric siderophore reductase